MFICGGQKEQALLGSNVFLAVFWYSFGPDIKIMTWQTEACTVSQAAKPWYFLEVKAHAVDACMVHYNH